MAKRQRTKTPRCFVNVQLPPDPLLLDTGGVTNVIAGYRSAPWLKDFFLDYIPLLWMAIEVERRAPTRKQRKANLDTIAQSAHVLLLALENPDVDDLFRSAGLDAAMKRHPFGSFLRSIKDCAKQEADALTTDKGTVRPGSGRAATADFVSRHVYCAVIIVEAWKHLHGQYPAARNERAQEAAALFWKDAGGVRSGHSPDVRKSWRGHLEKALMEPALPRLAAFRAEVVRYLFEAERMHRFLTEGDAAGKPTI